MIDIQSHIFLVDGFLPPQLVISAASTQSIATQQIAELCIDLNRLSLKRFQDVPLNIEDPVSLISVLLVAQATTSFESAVLLASVGMEGEARSLVRRCLEAAIIGFALVKKPELNVLHCLVADRHKHYKGLMNELPRSLNLSENHPLTVSLINYFRSLGEVPCSKKLDLGQLADAAGIKYVYDSIFRHLSADASHPTLDSLGKMAVHSPENGSVVSVSIRAKFEELGSTLLMAASSQLVAIEAIQIIYPDTEVAKIVATHQNTLRDVYKEIYPEWATIYFVTPEDKATQLITTTSTSV